MAQNFPGPYEIRFQYSTPTVDFPNPLVHTARYNVNLEPPIGGPGSAVSNFNVVQRDGTAVQINTAFDTWLSLIAPLYSDETSFGPVSLWEIAPESFDGTFLTTWTPGVTQGTNVNPNKPAGQLILTYRTGNGGIMRVSLMETEVSAGPTVPISQLTGDEALVAAYLWGDTNFFIGRDNGYPIAALNWLPGRNERLFKERFR